MTRIWLGLLASVAIATPVWAQSNAPPQTDVNQTGGSLSKKLSETGGVIHPQDSVDPAMQKTAPSTGTMPVIPPPGSPGGAKGVEPK